MRTIGRTALFAVIVLSVWGCGSQASAPAKAPEPEKQPVAKAEPAPAETKVAEAKSEDPEEKDPRADGLRKASRPPGELITGPNLIYMFNFKESEVGQAAKEKCSEQFADSRGEMAACMEKARGKVPVESVRFMKDRSGQLWWVTYNRYKGNLLKWHKVQYMPGEEKEDRITLNLIGKDEGIAPMARVPRSLLVELPNDYTIVVKHPEHGAMYYDAKIGTMEDN